MMLLLCPYWIFAALLSSAKVATAKSNNVDRLRTELLSLPFFEIKRGGAASHAYEECYHPSDFTASHQFLYLKDEVDELKYRLNQMDIQIK